MTDKELLELAAKAAGIELIPMQVNNVTKKGDDRFIGYMTKAGKCLSGWFDPLTDDGDALRLAVKLNLLVDITSVETEAGNADGYQCEIHNNDPYASTRRAIVRAAAEIGKTL